MAGGKRSGAGRPKGAPNKSNAEIKALAQKYTAKGIEELAVLAGLAGDGAADTCAARIAASYRKIYNAVYLEQTGGLSY